jgi:hypothetical protein
MDKRRIALTVIKPTPKPTSQNETGKNVILLDGVNGVSWNENGKGVGK